MDTEEINLASSIHKQIERLTEILKGAIYFQENAVIFYQPYSGFWVDFPDGNPHKLPFSLGEYVLAIKYLTQTSL